MPPPPRLSRAIATLRVRRRHSADELLRRCMLICQHVASVIHLIDPLAFLHIIMIKTCWHSIIYQKQEWILWHEHMLT